MSHDELLEYLKERIDYVAERVDALHNTAVIRSECERCQERWVSREYLRGLGTDFWTGGLAIVGDQGPELVNLPRGSQVFPADLTAELLKTREQRVYNLTANYKYQDERTLRDEIRLLQLLESAT